MSEGSTDRKKFMFYDTEQNQAKLKIRCAYDGMSQSQFFRIPARGRQILELD